MKKPYLSIIVPCYNSAGTIIPLIKSILSSKFKNYEIIIVDDGSTDDSRFKVQNVKLQFKIKNLRLIKQENRGAGAARNVGARLACGKILVFADSDIILFPKTLSYIVRNFKNKKVKAVFGTYDKMPANPKPSFFHKFKAMRDYSYMNIERDKNSPVGVFGAWISAVERKFFLEIRGFDENFKGAGLEDIEMGWRINEVNKVIFNPKIKVRHNFDGFIKTLKNFYSRSFLWMSIFEKYKKLTGPAMNRHEVVVAGLANLSTFFLFLSFFWPFFWPVFFGVFCLRLYFGRKFALFCLKEKGLVFLVGSLFVSHTLYLAVYSGVLKYAFFNPKKFLKMLYYYS